ncbi:serine/threonine-protein kinase [Thermomonospora echinospora]|uniref:serine/threonine-protein kinase n=1 Tax=Thermomonospora echinospora TaxID=1992 RepID=UPI00190E9195|nr:serine/threonine-protein kinase [Thermomonospora echinospora]
MTGWRVSGFREVRELGRGAQGRVVLARHEQAGTPVAIKYLAAEASEDDRGRFRHEAQMLGRVSSPHVARLYRLVESEHGTALVMEAVDGVSLKEILARYGALEPEAALTVLKGSLLGLATAHAVGVVHRDYKPANVMVPADGRSKLIDFGIAVSSGAASAAGTPYYMAPEQWNREPATPATDVYAATCVFYECVTGHRPFEAGERLALMALHGSAPVPLEDVPEPLRPLVVQGMAKQAEQRPPGAMAFIEELERLARRVYGPDWEARGVRAMATTAVALAALFPLTAAGLAVQGGSAAGAAAGGGQAGAGVLAKVGGTKAVLAVVGTTAVAGGGFAVYEVARADPPAPAVRQVSLQVDTRSFTDPNTNLIVEGAQFVTVRGLKDTALERRVNQALQRPIDDAVARYRTHYAQQTPEFRQQQRQEPADSVSRMKLLVRTRIGLRGPRLVSVGHYVSNPVNAGGGSDPAMVVVTLDLTTGRSLTAADIMRPDTLSKAGVARLSRSVPSIKFSGPPTPADHCRPTIARDYGDRPREIPALLTPTGVDFGFVSFNECVYNGWSSVPYTKISQFLEPSVVGLAQTRP